MNNSTSIHQINPDIKKLNLLNKFAYMLLNYANNSFPNKFDKNKLIIEKFEPQNSQQNMSIINQKSSPSRAICDLFWNNLDWEQLTDFISCKVNFLELGCGSGRYSQFYIKGTGKKFNSYTGIDIYTHQHWTLQQSNLPNEKIQFAQYNGIDIETFLENNDINFVVSQSVLEHCEFDKTLIEKIYSYAKAKKKKIVQVHLIPSAECLSLYTLHGIRQYTPRTISKLVTDNHSSYNVYKLGNSECNSLHWKYISLPYYLYKKDFRETKSKEYSEKLIEAIFKQNDNKASFYALIIKTDGTKIN